MWPFRRNNRQTYEPYAHAYDRGDYNRLDPDQAIGHIKNFAQNAPTDVQETVYQRHFAQMPYGQREAIARQVPRKYGMNPDDPDSMAHGFARLGQERPDLLERIFRHPLLLGAGVALGGLVAKHMIARHERRSDSWQPEEDRRGGGWAGRPW